MTWLWRMQWKVGNSEVHAGQGGRERFKNCQHLAVKQKAEVRVRFLGGLGREHTERTSQQVL